MPSPQSLLRCNTKNNSAQAFTLFDSLTIARRYLFPVNSIDDIIINRIFSPFTGWVQHHLGLSQWRLSLICLDGSIAFYLAGVAFTIARKGMNDGIFTDLLAAMGWLAIMTFARNIAYRQANSSMGVQSARLGEWFFRTLLTASFPLSLAYVNSWSSLCFSTSLFFLISHLYFKACDTPPPERTGKLAFNRA